LSQNEETDAKRMTKCKKRDDEEGKRNRFKNPSLKIASQGDRRKENMRVKKPLKRVPG